MSGWRVTQLTHPGSDGTGHSHSYYDIPVLDGAGRHIAAHRLTFAGRHPGPEDAVEVGIVDADTPGSWHAVGTSCAWSWQQGPMAQWVAGGPRLIWNDREEGEVIARLMDTQTGSVRTLPGQVYALTPDGHTAISLDMRRLNSLRPGYGYPGSSGPGPRRPADDGVWTMDMESGKRRLILSLDRAVRFLDAWHGWGVTRLRRVAGRMHYWFNHPKIAPDGRRFTVKLRWRRPGRNWSSKKGVSLTCGIDGDDLRLLAPATSHVNWLDAEHLYFWQHGSGVTLFRDTAPEGTRLGPLSPEFGPADVHIRHLDPGGRYLVFDTPYRETVDLMTLDRETGVSERLARFTGHTPRNGPFRCDLHPAPSSEGQRIVVTSLQGGTRQIHIAERT